MVAPVNELMLKTMDGKGSNPALTYHTGEESAGTARSSWTRRSPTIRTSR